MHMHPSPIDEVRLTPVPAASGPTGLRNRTTRLAVVGGFVLIGLGAGAAVLTGAVSNPFAKHSTTDAERAASSAPLNESIPTVKVVTPKMEAAVSITVEQLAMVEPYYRADLRARASGIVQKVHHDLGDKVKRGDVLIEIDVPELQQDISKAEAMILQREQELKVSEAKLKEAKSARDVSAATIKQRDADVQGATATRDLKKRMVARYKELSEKGTVVGNVVEEEEKNLLATEATLLSALANVERARADFAESESKVEAAMADIHLKKATIEVARKDLDRARAVADYAKVTAPFDGIVVRRTVDPGSFVQNATTGASEMLISIARMDLVTVSARFPDIVASSVTNELPAEVRINDLPGVTIPAKVSRFAPSVQNDDRTMRVEVDLFNGDAKEYQQLVDAMKPGTKLDRGMKGVNDSLPLRAFPAGSGKDRRLLPGMTGSIKLSTVGFGDSHVIPSAAVYSRSGTSYILVVEDGVTKQMPVKVQLNDGKTSRVTIISRQKGADGKTRDVLMDLTGREQVVLARQLEIGDGAKVKTGPTDW